jgi:hypothetical protein
MRMGMGRMETYAVAKREARVGLEGKRKERRWEEAREEWW